MRLLVCGGAGFIGSTFARQRVLEMGDQVTVLDKLTYAGREENLQDLAESPSFGFLRGAIEDRDAVSAAVEEAAPEAIVNFAAETHVDRSIAEPDAFVRTHALGTYVLLDVARENDLRYVQVSTDEVYGSIELGTFTEESPLRPSSPYSATKTGADLLVQSYFHTYGLPALICRGSNNYGPYQYPEKLIPLMILNALSGDSLPVYGDGMQVRNWIHASDFARAGRGLQRRRARRGGQHDRRRANRRAHRRRALADRARQRPTRPRPALLAVLREGPCARLGPAGALRRGPRRDGRLVSREQVVVGADPLRRLSALLRTPVRAPARVLSLLAGAARRPSTRPHATLRTFHFPPS
jgi:dTDP-glucose 4,6-dehydratase